MNLYKKKISILNNLISGIGIVFLGLIVTIGSINLYSKVVNIFVYIFIIMGLSGLVDFLISKKIVRNKQVLFMILIDIVLGFVMLIFPKVPLSLLPIIFSIYLFLNAAVKFINYITLREVGLKSRFVEIFFALIFIIFSFLFLFYPLDKLNLFITIIGIYCILFGLSRIYEFVIDILSDRTKLKIRKRIKMTLPLFFEAFVPKRALNNINKYIDYLTSEGKDKEQYADLKIFIHLSKYGFNQFGHMDIMFKDIIYSYGNYDKSSQKLFTCLGDGVLFTLRAKKKYIKYCIENSRKTVLEYGIKLNDNEKQKVEKELNDIMNHTIRWYPPTVVYDDITKNDYASKLYRKTKSKFYKFDSGIYKTYFVLGVNCTYFADAILKKCVFQVLKLVGIISPGTYYEYLEENYKKKNSKVVYRKIYNKENMGDWYYVKNKK